MDLAQTHYRTVYLPRRTREKWTVVSTPRRPYAQVRISTVLNRVTHRLRRFRRPTGAIIRPTRMVVPLELSPQQAVDIARDGVALIVGGARRCQPVSITRGHGRCVVPVIVPI